MSIVNLKNGSQENIAIVKMTTLVLKALLARGIQGGLMIYDLVERCKNRNYQMFPSHEKELKALSLLQPDGGVDNSIRNIVLSSVEREGVDMKFVSPLVE